MITAKDLYEIQFPIKQKDGSFYTISISDLLNIAYFDGQLGEPAWIRDDYTGSHDDAFMDFCQSIVNVIKHSA